MGSFWLSATPLASVETSSQGNRDMSMEYLSGVNREVCLGRCAGAACMTEGAGLTDELLQPPVLYIARQQLCPKLVAQLHIWVTLSHLQDTEIAKDVTRLLL